MTWTPDDAAQFRAALAQRHTDRAVVMAYWRRAVAAERAAMAHQEAHRSEMQLNGGDCARALGCAILFVSALVMLAVVVVIVWRAIGR